MGGGWVVQEEGGGKHRMRVQGMVDRGEVEMSGGSQTISGRQRGVEHGFKRRT